MLNKNLNASLSSSFTPFWRNAFSVSKEQTCWHSYSNHYIPEKPLQRGTSKHAIIEAVSQRLGLNTRVKHHGNLRRNCTLLYNWLVWHVEHTFSRGTLFFFCLFFFFERNIYFYLNTLTNRTVHYQYYYRLSVLFNKEYLILHQWFFLNYYYYYLFIYFAHTNNNNTLHLQFITGNVIVYKKEIKKKERQSPQKYYI